MPYYRRSYRRRGGYRRRRGGYSANRLAGMVGCKVGDWAGKKALAGVRYLSGLVNSEKFKKDNNFSTVISDTGSIVHLTGIANSDTDSGRTGNSIFVRSINGKGVITKNASAATTQVRMMLLIDTQQIGDTSPSISNVLLAARPTSPLNNNTVGRFKILWSRLFTLDDVRSMVNININKVLRHHIRYNGTASTDQQKGAIYLLYISDQATNTPSWNADIRISYHDN